MSGASASTCVPGAVAGVDVAQVGASFRCLLGVTDGVEALVHPSQRFVENLHLFTALFVGRLGCAPGTFGLYSRRTLAAQQAEVLLACLP